MISRNHRPDNHTADPGAITESAREVPIAGEYDVIICGGGTSGFPAAIAAARQGARVAVIERYGFLGGVPAYSIMPAWHGLKVHHSGLLTEFARRVVEFGQGPDPLANNHVEPETVKQLFLVMALEVGVEIHLHTLIVGAVKEGNAVRAIVTESKSGRRAFAAKAFVDATGDGDLAFHAGAGYMKGRDGKVQAMSLRFRIGHIDFDRYFDWVKWHPQYYGKNTIAGLDELRRKARAGEDFFMQGDLADLFREYPDADLPTQSYFNVSSIRPGELSVNGTRLHGVDGTVEEDLTRAEITCRKQAYALWRFLRARVPGFERSLIVDIPAQVGVRETRCIIGDYVLMEADCRANRRFPDAVMTTRLAFDLHDVDRYIMETIKGTVDVPYGCFVVRGLEGLLVAGRTLSCDHVANSTIRKMETAFQSGQVAGTAAGLAALRGVTPRALPVAALQETLLRDGLKINQDYRSPDIGTPGYHARVYEPTPATTGRA